MIASVAPIWIISTTAWARSSSSLNSWPTSSSASSSLGETTWGSARTASRSGIAVGVDDRDHPELLDLADQAGVDVGLDPARQAAGEHAHARALGQVQELVAEQLELHRRDRRAALVDLGVQAGGGVEHRGVGARLLADPDEVAEDRLVAERLDDPGPGGAAGQAGGDHRLAEPLDRPRDVDALTARHRRLVDRAVPAAGREVGDFERLVEGRVERDGDDHLEPAAAFARVRCRRNSTAPAAAPSTRISTNSVDRSRQEVGGDRQQS